MLTFLCFALFVSVVVTGPDGKDFFAARKKLLDFPKGRLLVGGPGWCRVCRRSPCKIRGTGV